MAVESDPIVRSMRERFQRQDPAVTVTEGSKITVISGYYLRKK